MLFGMSFETLLLLAIAFANAYTAWAIKQTFAKITLIEKNVQVVETATNSMKDALIVAAHKEGVANHKEVVRIRELEDKVIKEEKGV